MKKFVVEVGPSQIEGSNGQAADNCMVYRAMKPVFPLLEAVAIVHAIFLDEQSEHHYIELPTHVQDLIHRHYEGANPPPFKFEIEVPDHLCDS